MGKKISPIIDTWLWDAPKGVGLLLMGKTSVYQGVSCRLSFTGMKCEVSYYMAKPWTASLKHNGVKWYSRAFATEREAALAWDRRVLELGLDRELNILRRKL